MNSQKNKQNIYVFQTEIKSMLYAFGDTKNSSTKTMQFLENLTRVQMKKLLLLAIKIKNLKKARMITIEDICFVLRHNRIKIRRILSSVTYKELRKKISEDDGDDLEIDYDDTKFDWLVELNKRIIIRRKTEGNEKEQINNRTTKQNTANTVGNSGNNEPKDMSESIDDEKEVEIVNKRLQKNNNEKVDSNALFDAERDNLDSTCEGTNGNDYRTIYNNKDPQATKEMSTKKDEQECKRRKIETISDKKYKHVYNNLVTVDPPEEKDEGFKQRLKKIDEITKKMTIQEYLDYSECRQASFTYRKNKKFKDFLEINEKMKDDVIEVLGFIAYEMLYEIVDEALTIKQQSDKPVTENNGFFDIFAETSLDVADIEEGCRRILRRKKYLFL